MTLTKALDLVNVEVLADTISAELEKGIRFAPHARVEDTLVSEAGLTIKRPRYAYIGAAEDLEEGVPLDPTKMTATEATVTVKEAGKGIEPTYTSILANVDSFMDEAVLQLQKSVSDKIDMDYVATLGETELAHNAAPTSVDAIIDAVELFGDEDEEDYILFINPTDYNALRKSMIDGNTFLSQEQLADLLGLKEIVKSKRVEVGTAFVQKEGAVEIVYKRYPTIEKDKDIIKRTIVITINTLYATNLYNEGGVVKISAK